MIEIKQHDQWAETKVPRTLRDTRQEKTRRRTSSMGRAVVLGHVIRIEAETIVCLRQDQAIFVLMTNIAAVVVQVIENAAGEF